MYKDGHLCFNFTPLKLTMNKSIQTILTLRKNILQLTEGLTADQLNKIPEGFNNNIIWNMGHLVAVEQSVCYKRSGLPVNVDEEFVTAYMPDSKPGRPASAAEIENIKALLLSSTAQLEADYNDSIFKDYTPFITRYGAHLNNIEDAVSFLPFHEGLHTGYILALKKITANQHTQ